MMEQGFRGNCDSQGKLGMCPSLAELDSSGVPRAWHGDFAACGQRSGLLALNPASIFKKLLDQKTFISPAALSSHSAAKNPARKDPKKIEKNTCIFRKDVI